MIGTLELVYRALWAHLSPWAVLAGPCLLALGVSVNRRFSGVHSRLLDWSPFRIKANVALLPLRTRLWAAWLVLLVAVIPLTALLEELMFRAPAHGLLPGVAWGGLAFGFLHLTSLVSVRMCLYLSAIGLVFVGVYDAWGLWAVWTLHASYNLSAVGLVLREKMAR